MDLEEFDRRMQAFYQQLHQCEEDERQARKLHQRKVAQAAGLLYWDIQTEIDQFCDQWPGLCEQWKQARMAAEIAKQEAWR